MVADGIRVAVCPTCRHYSLLDDGTCDICANSIDYEGIAYKALILVGILLSYAALAGV